MSTTQHRGRTSISALTIALVAAAVGGMLTGCEREPTTPRPTPAAPVADVVGPGSGTSFLAYARSLVFDPVHGDEQRLMLIDSRTGEKRYGPLARIEAEIGGFALSRSELAQGRVLGRLINLDVMPYPKLGLGPRDTTYVWVDSVSGRWRALLIPTNSRVSRVSTTVRFEMHPGHEHLQAHARWRWNENDEDTWVPCVRHGCCIIPGD